MPDTAPAFHPEPESLLAYATGALGEAHSVLLATHLALCPRCRAEVGRLEAVGGLLAAELPPTPLARTALEATLARLDEPEPETPAAAAPRPRLDDATRRAVPQPLRGYLAASLAELPWKRRGLAVREMPLAIGGGGIRAALIRVRGGGALPAHTHHGIETTLVLRGAFMDAGQRFGRGDVAIATSDDDHQPVAAEGEECLCFAVVEGALRLTGPVGRLLNPFLRL